MEKKFNYVYITTNIINGKQYVGSHATDIIDDNYLGSGKYFYKALKKEGKTNFKREVLCECETILEARQLESVYIEKYNTLVPNGYNISDKGGFGYKGASHSKETIEKIRKANLGRKVSEETKEKQRQKKLGISTKRRGKGIKQEMIEKYGEKEGLERYNTFVEKQRKTHKGKTQSKETIEKRIKNTGEPWNKGKQYTTHPWSEEQKQKLRKPKTNTKYKKILTPELEFEIQNLYKAGVKIKQIQKITPIKNFYKIKEIINKIM